ncbi:MAG: hypothetical protein P8165_00790 [Deltaproteobacteria bacterium]|jgi:hypothetical protein
METHPNQKVHLSWYPKLFAAVFAGMFFVIPAAVYATASTEETPVHERVVIQDKAPGAIIINGERFKVTDATLIIDILGKRIALCDLPVPCEADVEYQQSEGPSSLCLVIETRRLLPGADVEGKSGAKD